VVDGVMRNGKCKRNDLKRKDHLEIEKNIRDVILLSGEFPTIAFKGNGSLQTGTSSVPGQLTLRERKQEVQLIITKSDQAIAGQIEIQPSRWGISPFRALLGAIRVQDRVQITFELPLEP
jgi:polyisoprenoid-binding protein YceI